MPGVDTETIELGDIGTEDGTGVVAKDPGGMLISSRQPCGTQPERTTSLSDVA